MPSDLAELMMQVREEEKDDLKWEKTGAVPGAIGKRFHKFGK